MSSTDACRPSFSRSPFNSDSCVSQAWAIAGGSVDLPDSLSPGTRLLIWGGLWFLLKSFHTRMIHAVPAALNGNTDTIVASLLAGIRLYLSFCKRWLDTGASVVDFGWILNREQMRTTKKDVALDFYLLVSPSFLYTHQQRDKSFRSKCLTCQQSRGPT